jgi:helicase MOV-10
MSTSRAKITIASGAPNLLSDHFVLPSKNIKVLQIRPPQGVNSKQRRTPSPQKKSSVSRKKSEVSGSDSTPASAFDIPRPPIISYVGGDGAAKTTESQPEHVKGRAEWPNLSCSPSKIASKTPVLDVYAPSYVPLWLRAANESIAVPRFCSSLQTINFPEYITSFAGSQYLQPLASVKPPAIQFVPVVHSIAPESLSSNNYSAYFWEALQNEVFAEAADLRSCNIFAAAFEVQDHLRQLFRVRIPGLRENSPRIDLGDVVLLRPLFHRPDAPELTTPWCAPGGGRERGLCAPAFAGLEFHAIVWGVARAKEEILLRVDGLTGLSCNIIFAVQEHRITPIARSIATIAESLGAPRSAPITSDWLHRMLFPTSSDCVVQLTLPKGTFPDMKWFDTQLNYEQQKAVDAVLNSDYGNVPYLISGPPGTGKTKTIVEVTLQLLQRSQPPAGGLGGAHQAPHILLCAPSDSAADTLASRLATRVTPAELFRLNGWPRSFAEVPGGLLPYSYIDKDLFSLPSFEALMSYKVVVTTCRDADMLVQARLTNQALGHLTRSTLRVVAPEAYGAISEAQLLHWTTLLIDEAAQATEPEALIPLMVVAPPLEAQTENKGLSTLPQLVMAGDEYQLGPRLCSGKLSALSTSLFARLFSRSLYAQHPLSRQRGSQRLIASMLPMNRPAFANLVRNYRSHPSILSVPSQLFYNDTLIPESGILSDIVRTWPGWKSPCCWPVLFVQNTTPDAVESVLSGNGTGAGALTNHGEALNALQLVQGLLEHRVPDYEVSGQIREAEIAVMSPFRTQVNLLRKIFRERGLHDVNIGPLEAFQGLESRIVVLCTTRTRRGAEGEKAARFVREDRERGLGVIGEPKRFNVAITRAKEGLIVLGDPQTLTVEGDLSWEAFISFCARNGCVMHENSSDMSWPDEFAKKEGCKEGRLERALVFAADVKTREATRKEQRGFGYPESPETRRQRRVSLKGQMPTTDEEMWKTGLQMAEGTDESTLIEDEDVDQRAGNGQEEDPDPWNADRYAAGRHEDLLGRQSRTRSPSFTVVGGTGTEVPKGSHVFSPPSAREFDRDPKAEFERTDCSTQ